MLKRIRDFLTEATGAASQGPTALPDERVAVCAVLLEVAEADKEFAPEEWQEVVLQLRAYFGLSEEQADALVRITQEEREGSSDLWPFTTTISREFTPEQKAEVLTMVWQVILADEKLDPYEDQLARRMQGLLSVNHSVLMTAKARARENRRTREH